MEFSKQILAIAIGFLLCLLTCNRESTVDPIVEYIPGDTVRDTIDKLVPKLVEVVKWKQLPRVIDTVYTDGDTVYVSGVVDTIAIVNDYALRKTYEETLVDNDTIGFIAINAVVQYNTLSKFGYTYVPIQKSTTTVIERNFTPFVSLELNTNQYAEIGGGLYYKHVGCFVTYSTNFGRDGPVYGVGITKKW